MKKTNLEWLKENFSKFVITDNDLMCEVAYLCKTGKRCECIGCTGKNNCQFSDIKCAIDYLAQEHKELIKLTKFEFDLLMTQPTRGIKFKQLFILMDMKTLGYYKDIKDTSMFLDQIIENCEVVEC